MPRATVYLGEPAGQELVNGTWKYARGYVPGEQHTIALLAANGPLAAPGGTVFVRYANLAFEWTGV